jgi:hypothetical protein
MLKGCKDWSLSRADREREELLHKRIERSVNYSD